MDCFKQSFLDDDTYNFSQFAVARKWPECRVKYRYTNRDPDFHFREGFDKELKYQLRMIADLRFTETHFRYFEQALPWVPRDALQVLQTIRLNPDDVCVIQSGPKLTIEITGRWYETIFWEVTLLSTISQLAFSLPLSSDMFTKAVDWEDRIKRKAERLANAGVNWIDFGTRRRFSYEVQDKVVEIMKGYAPFFRGTSNPHLAMKHGVKPQGTYAHQGPMAMQARYGVRSADQMWMNHWFDTYKGNLGTALTDTHGTDKFLRFFTSEYANQFTGVRQDSGDPFRVGDMIVAHYEKLGIDPTTKVIVFSDSLDVDKAIALHTYFKGRIRTTMGIGTNLTNDVGYTPMSQVIKLVEADFGYGFGHIGLVKLSDDEGKETGTASDITQARFDLRTRP